MRGQWTVAAEEETMKRIGNEERQLFYQRALNDGYEASERNSMEHNTAPRSTQFLVFSGGRVTPQLPRISWMTFIGWV
jgi:hypothetical protein